LDHLRSIRGLDASAFFGLLRALTGASRSLVGASDGALLVNSGQSWSTENPCNYQASGKIPAHPQRNSNPCRHLERVVGFGGLTLASAGQTRFRNVKTVGRFTLGIPWALTSRHSNSEWLNRIEVTVRNHALMFTFWRHPTRRPRSRWGAYWP
jgi:hypothetical protein